MWIPNEVMKKWTYLTFKQGIVRMHLSNHYQDDFLKEKLLNECLVSWFINRSHKTWFIMQEIDKHGNVV